MENLKNKYHNSPFERGVGVCYQSNTFIFLIFQGLCKQTLINLLSVLLCVNLMIMIISIRVSGLRMK